VLDRTASAAPIHTNLKKKVIIVCILIHDARKAGRALRAHATGPNDPRISNDALPPKTDSCRHSVMMPQRRRRAVDNRAKNPRSSTTVNVAAVLDHSATKHPEVNISTPANSSTNQPATKSKWSTNQNMCLLIFHSITSCKPISPLGAIANQARYRTKPSCRCSRGKT